jgi:hypothetical protein
MCAFAAEPSLSPIQSVKDCESRQHLPDRRTIGDGGKTRQSTARKQFNASDFSNYWCGPFFRARILAMGIIGGEFARTPTRNHHSVNDFLDYWCSLSITGVACRFTLISHLE